MSSGSDWAELLGTDIPRDVKAELEQDRARLAVLAGELALKFGARGVTVSDLRQHAQAFGIVLTGCESSARIKRLNLGALLPRAGLVATKEFRRSVIGKSHGNPHVVHVLPEFAEVA